MSESVQRSAPQGHLSLRSGTFSVQNKSVAQQRIPTLLTPHSSLLTLKISQGDF